MEGPTLRMIILALAAIVPAVAQEPDCPDFQAEGSTFRVSKGDAYRSEGGK